MKADIAVIGRDYFGAHTYERIDKPRGEFSTPTGSDAEAALLF